jgi:hypothetical protein
MMVSVWLAIGMLFLGAYAGMLVFALMSMAARETERRVKDEEAVERDGVAQVDLDKEWTA